MNLSECTAIVNSREKSIERWKKESKTYRNQYEKEYKKANAWESKAIIAEQQTSYWKKQFGLAKDDYESRILRLRKELESYHSKIDDKYASRGRTTNCRQGRSKSSSSSGLKDQASEAGEQVSVIDGSIIDFAKNVVPTNSSLSLSIHKSSDDSIVEAIGVNSRTLDGLVSFETRIEDYSHNTIALSLNDFTDKLASQYGVKADSQTGDYWASKLRDDWLLVIGDQSYEAKSKSEWPTDAGWSYHELTPEYTPGEDLSGTKQILLSPKTGIDSLKIKPKKALSCGTDYYLQVEKGDLKIKGFSKALDASKLNLDLDCSTESSSTKQTFVISKPSKFKKKSVDKIINFNPLTDEVKINVDSFGIPGDDIDDVVIANAKSSKEVKMLANEDHDFIFDISTNIFYNENGSRRGFGEGGTTGRRSGSADIGAVRDFTLEGSVLDGLDDRPWSAREEWFAITVSWSPATSPTWTWTLLFG